MIESDNTKTKGITSIDKEKVEIKIPLNNGSFWVKEYNKSDLIHQLIEDFKGENNEEIPEEYINDWKEKNGSFKMTDEIRTLLPNEVNGSFIFSEIFISTLISIPPVFVQNLLCFFVNVSQNYVSIFKL